MSPLPFSVIPVSRVRAELCGGRDGLSSESMFLEGCPLTVVTARHQVGSRLDSPHTKGRTCGGRSVHRHPLTPSVPLTRERLRVRLATVCR